MLSALILAKNEEKNIERCLNSLSFCDEIIVVDDNSLDQTVTKAKKYNAEVISHPLDGDFSAQRNRLIERAKGDWLLFIDADEEVTAELSGEITQTLLNPQFSAFYMRRRDFFWGKTLTHGEVQQAFHKGFIRLVKKGSGSWKGNVHEEFVTEKPVGQLTYFLNHFPHETLSEFIANINYYSTIRAKELLVKGHKTNVIEIIFFPFVKFFYTYFLKRGFADGAAGFAYSFMMSFHSFLVRSKLYQYQHLDSSSP